jgi:hypothetical protein
MAVDPDPTQVMTTEEPTQEMSEPVQQMDENFTYEQFRQEERLSLVRGRLRELESQHYNKKLDMYVVPSEQTDAILQQAADLESKIMELRQEEDAVEAETPQSEQQPA